MPQSKGVSVFPNAADGIFASLDFRLNDFPIFEFLEEQMKSRLIIILFIALSVFYLSCMSARHIADEYVFMDVKSIVDGDTFWANDGKFVKLQRGARNKNRGLWSGREDGRED